MFGLLLHVLKLLHNNFFKKRKKKRRRKEEGEREEEREGGGGRRKEGMEGKKERMDRPLASPLQLSCLGPIRLRGKDRASNWM